MEQDRMSAVSQSHQSNQYSSEAVYPNQVKIKKDVPNILRTVDYQSFGHCLTAWLLCDDGERRRFVVENEHEGKSVLSNIIGDKKNFYRGGILETIKDPVTNKKTDKWYSSKDPELMDIVKYNGDKTGRSGSWKLKEEHLFNVIDRSLEPDDNGNTVNWCAVNKKTKLLILGVKAFDALKETRDNFGNLDDYDINYKKTGDGLNTTHTIMKAGDQVKGVVIGPLTEEEKAYEKWDLKFATRLSSATYVLKHLRNIIGRIDAIMGTNFIGDLEAQSAIERAEWEAKKESSVDSSEGSTAPSTPSESAGAYPEITTPGPQAAPQMTPSPIRRAAVTNKNMVKCGNEECGKMVPEGTEVCPHCGMTLLLPCDNCGKIMSAFATECPHCGQNYQVG